MPPNDVNKHGDLTWIVTSWEGKGFNWINENNAESFNNHNDIIVYLSFKKQWWMLEITQNEILLLTLSNV